MKRRSGPPATTRPTEHPAAITRAKTSPIMASADDRRLVAAGYPTIAEQEHISASIVAGEEADCAAGRIERRDAIWLLSERDREKAAMGRRLSAVPTKKHYLTLTCTWPGCGEKFRAQRRSAKFCDEHRKPKYKVRASRERKRNAKNAARVWYTPGLPEREYSPANTGGAEPVSVTSAHREVAE